MAEVQAMQLMEFERKHKKYKKIPYPSPEHIEEAKDLINEYNMTLHKLEKISCAIEALRV